jgi:4-aminobutyrate aminotransferase-like enzyme
MGSRVKKEEVIEKQRRFLFPCVASYYQEPIVVDRAHGTTLIDTDGKEYLDFFGGIATISVGHCNEKVTSAAQKQIKKLQHTSTLYPNEPHIRLAEKLAEITPGGLQKSFFTNSGTEANETAVLLAQLHTRSQDVIALRHGYSGRSYMAMSLTAHFTWRLSPSPMPAIHHIPRIAAFLAEPIQGIGGFITPPKEYFQEIVSIVRKYGGLFICDEVQTGWGRTGGKLFGIEHWGVEPDIMTFAKGMADGFPMGATIARAEVADSMQGMSISTFGGNPVSSTAALTTIKVIKKENLVENARLMGQRLREGLELLREKYPVIGDVRGMGLMQAIELVGENKRPDADAVLRMLELTKSNGLLIGKGGLMGNVIRITPPLNVSKDHVDQALKALDVSFSRLGL